MISRLIASPLFKTFPLQKYSKFRVDDGKSLIASVISRPRACEAIGRDFHLRHRVNVVPPVILTTSTRKLPSAQTVAAIGMSPICVRLGASQLPFIGE
jgi:hypothetical protein